MRRPKSSKSIVVHQPGGSDSGIIETPREARKQIAPAEGGDVGASLSMAISAESLESLAAADVRRSEPGAAPPNLSLLRLSGRHQRHTLPRMRHESSLLDGCGESQPRGSLLGTGAGHHRVAGR